MPQNNLKMIHLSEEITIKIMGSESEDNLRRIVEKSIANYRLDRSADVDKFILNMIVTLQALKLNQPPDVLKRIQLAITMYREHANLNRGLVI